MKFTKQIKEDWLKALKSGKFKQGYGYLVFEDRDDKSGKKEHCCIGVLGEITEGLSNSVIDGDSPYLFLRYNIGDEATENLYRTNDKNKRLENDPQDYANVIPLIENLKTND